MVVIEGGLTAIILKVGQLMTEQGLSEAELSQLTGLGGDTVRKLGSGDAAAIRFSTLDGVCRALGCRPGDVIVYAPGEGRG